jgi:uncharacterized RDD family membrane protein YckC
MMNQDTSAASTQAVLTEDVTGKRIVAAIIDIVVLAVVFVVFAMLFGDSNAETEDSASVSLNLSGGPAIIYFLVVLAYYWLMEAATGKTLGKMMMGLPSAGARRCLYPNEVLHSHLLRIIDGLPFFYLLGSSSWSSSKRKQRIGDMAAGTDRRQGLAPPPFLCIASDVKRWALLR